MTTTWFAPEVDRPGIAATPIEPGGVAPDRAGPSARHATPI